MNLKVWYLMRSSVLTFYSFKSIPTNGMLVGILYVLEGVNILGVVNNLRFNQQSEGKDIFSYWFSIWYISEFSSKVLLPNHRSD